MCNVWCGSARLLLFKPFTLHHSLHYHRNGAVAQQTQCCSDIYYTSFTGVLSDMMGPSLKMMTNKENNSVNKHKQRNIDVRCVG